MDNTDAKKETVKETGNLYEEVKELVTLPIRHFTTDDVSRLVPDMLDTLDRGVIYDIKDVISKDFSVWAEMRNDRVEMADKARFVLNDEIQIAIYNSERDPFGNESELWELDVFFGCSDREPCVSYISFKQMIEALKDFIYRIKAAIKEKEDDLSLFYDFYSAVKKVEEGHE